MAYRAKLFVNLSVMVIIIAVLVVGAGILFQNNVMRYNNQFWATAAANAKTDQNRAWYSSLVKTPSELDASISQFDTTFATGVAMVSLFIVVPLLLLSWRNRVGHLEEIRYDRSRLYRIVDEWSEKKRS